MPGFMKRLYKVMDEADIIVEVLDARFPKETTNRIIEEFATRNKKTLIRALNKSDLVSKKFLIKATKMFEKTIIISAKERTGINILKKTIKKGAKEQNKVAFVGYPNTGKSSLINAISGRKSAPTSIKAGFTRGEQFIRISKEIMLIDSPGIISYGEMDEAELALLGAKGFEQIKDIERCAEHIATYIINANPKVLSSKYNLTKTKEADEVLEDIAKEKCFLLKGGKPDVKRASRLVLEEWQKGKLNVFKN